MPRLDRARLGESEHLDLLGRALCTHPLAPWPLSQPLLNELTGNGPDTGARQDITIRHTQLQPIVCLFQLPDHLLNKLDIAGAVADEGIKTLGHLPWVQSTRVMSKLYRGGAQAGTPSLGDLGPEPYTNPEMTLRESALPGRGKMSVSPPTLPPPGAKPWVDHETDTSFHESHTNSDVGLLLFPFLR